MRWRTGLSLAAVAALLLPAVGCETAGKVATGVDQLGQEQRDDARPPSRLLKNSSLKGTLGASPKGEA